MAFAETGHIWMNGEMIPWKEANIHICSHVIHYGTSVFEGIRAYNVKGRPAIFRLHDHIRRLVDSAKIYRMEVPYSVEELKDACVKAVRDNGFDSCYIRPIVYRGYNALGVNPDPCPVDTAIATWEWGKYLGDDAMVKGVDVCVSSWNRMAPNTLPAMAKCGANYMNSQLIKMEALANGYTEGIALDTEGYVSEASGENIFVIRDGVAHTPPVSSSILTGITRHVVMTLAKELDIEVRERKLSREELYLADEVFFTGTAAEVSAVRSIDQVQIGEGKRGPVTERLQSAFFDYVEGRREDDHGWLTFCR